MLISIMCKKVQINPVKRVGLSAKIDPIKNLTRQHCISILTFKSYIISFAILVNVVQMLVKKREKMLGIMYI